MEQDKKMLELRKLLRYGRFTGKDVLEVGCGDGRISRFLAGFAGKLVAIDPDKRLIRQARSRIKGAEFRAGRGEKLEFEGESFDVVVFVLSLHHQNAGKSLAEAARVLRRRGRIVVLEPAADGEIQGLFNLAQDETRLLEKAAKAIAGSGMRIEKKETFSTRWVFESAKELYRFYFKHSGGPRNGRTILKIGRFLGKKAESGPVILKDKLTIFSVRKNESPGMSKK